MEGKGTNSPVCVAGLEPDGNTCELKAQTPDGEIEIGDKCDRNTWPAGGSGFKNRRPPFAFPIHEDGTASRQRRPHADTKATDSRFTQITHSER